MPERPPEEEREVPAPGFDTFDDFVKAAIKEYYGRGWRSRKGNFIALLIASGQSLSLARDAVSGEDGLKKAAIGAASVAVLRFVLIRLLPGWGLLSGAAGVASMVAFFVKNQKEIVAKIPRYRDVLAESQRRFEEIQSGYRANRYEARERNLMVDGLHKRFLAEIDEV